MSELITGDHIYEKINKAGTGDHDNMIRDRIIVCPYDKYEIYVRVSQQGQFIDIESVKVKKSFLTMEQTLSNIGLVDIGKYYIEEDD